MIFDQQNFSPEISMLCKIRSVNLWVLVFVEYASMYVVNRQASSPQVVHWPVQNQLHSHGWVKMRTTPTPICKCSTNSPLWTVVENNILNILYVSLHTLDPHKIDYWVLSKRPHVLSNMAIVSGKNYSQGFLVGLLKWQRLSCLIWRMAFPSCVWKMK